ncbi:MAG: hypothetical protein FWG33_00360 [Oscillospiraceae bacterium]|nr:hypothetical protein [Oscillospiraceae bacterium]
MNQNILEKVYDAYCGDSITDKDIREVLDNIQTKLLNKMNDEESQLFNQFVTVWEERAGNLSRENFNQGFRASMMLMIESLQN